MLNSRIRGLSLIFILLATAVGLSAAAIDSTLSTTYSLLGSTKIDWSVCGSVGETSGCYGAGTIGPFGKIGPMIEGNPASNLAKGTVTRNIYVLDTAAGSSGTGVELYIYKKVDTITADTDTITVTLFKTVNLPLTGGATTIAYLAANKNFLFIGTNQDYFAIRVQKNNLALQQYGEVSGPATVSAITADPYGFVTVTWVTPDGSNAFLVFNPDGLEEEDGGGAPFMLNTIQAVPTALP